MSRAEKFIKSKIRIGSNTSSSGWRRKGVFIPSCSLPWLTPDDARKAVEIAREEIYEWFRVNLCNYFDDTGETFDKCIDDLKQAMKDG